jgi:protein KRI1
MATDKELNEYMSVKKYAPYRLAKADKHRFGPAQQEKLRDLKSKVAERTGGGIGFGDGAEREVKQKKRKGKKERMRMKAEVAGAVESAASTVAPEALDDELSIEKKKKKRKRDGDGDEKLGSTEENGHSVKEGDVKEDAPVKKKRKRKQQKGSVNPT